MVLTYLCKYADGVFDSAGKLIDELDQHPQLH